MSNKINIIDSEIVNKNIEKGNVLLGTTNDEYDPNFMTIGWGFTGTIWSGPVFIALVRPSRYSFKNLEKKPHFTINILKEKKNSRILEICGSKSFYSVNKIKKYNIDYNLTKNKIPFHPESIISFECKVIYKQLLEKSNFCTETKNKWYPKNDIHWQFYGKIVNRLL